VGSPVVIPRRRHALAKGMLSFGRNIPRWTLRMGLLDIARRQEKASGVRYENSAPRRRGQRNRNLEARRLDELDTHGRSREITNLLYSASSSHKDINSAQSIRGDRQPWNQRPQTRVTLLYTEKIYLISTSGSRACPSRVVRWEKRIHRAYACIA